MFARRNKRIYCPGCFQVAACLLVLSFAAPLFAQKGAKMPTRFLFGANFYPELQTRDEWNKMLDEFAKANFNTVRILDSAWGNIETAPGKFEFGWVHDFLDDLRKHKMKAILGTGTFIAPQWLLARNPEALVELRPGWRVHPMARKSASLGHPLYRQACRRYIAAIAKEFKDHRAVIGWQLDNEIENILSIYDYNPAEEEAWQNWLKNTYRTVDELNDRLSLVSWGMKVSSFEEVAQPREVFENVRPDLIHLPALELAHLHFRRDLIGNFLIEQTQTLRDAGVEHWITTDWNARWDAMADDPLARRALDVSGLNFYQPVQDAPDYWKNLAWHHDMHRSAHKLGRFLVMETTIGVTGHSVMWNPFTTRQQWRMWMLQPVAFGSGSIMYWSGNRWLGGHWPHWGGVLDWTGKPEPDFEWLIELGKFFREWGGRLLAAPVKADAVVLTDFDQRAALSVYPHSSKKSLSVLPDAFNALHRLGVGVDSVHGNDCINPANLKKYRLLVIPVATCLEGGQVPLGLKAYVKEGGNILITPFTAYQTWSGVFRGDGFAANLSELTGVLVRTVRRMGTSDYDGRQDQQVEWTLAGMDGLSAVGVDGFCELVEVEEGTEVIARFKCSANEPFMDGRAAATRKKVGKGTVIKLAFWPKDNTVIANLAKHLVPVCDMFEGPAPAGVQVVPRTDGSVFFINTESKPKQINLTKTATDRISGEELNGQIEMSAHAVLWLK
jgi:beta-galactosidase